MSLLAVDLGIKTGLALYDAAGRLVWYRSHNYGTTERLKQDVPRILDAIPQLSALVIEGGGKLATVWEKEASAGQLNCYASVQKHVENCSSTQGNRRLVMMQKSMQVIFRNLLV